MDRASSNENPCFVKWLFRASCRLMFGLTITVPNALELLDARLSHSPWRNALVSFSVLLLVWMIVAPLWASDQDPKPETKKEDGFTFAMVVCLGLVAWQARFPLMFGLLGILSALLFLRIGWIRQRSYYVETVGWFLSGLTVTRFAAWPEQDQGALFLFLGGVATSLQGAWELFADARAYNAKNQVMSLRQR